MAGFFVVEKKDKSLRLCIHYWDINDIIVKNQESLPFITSVFYLLQGANIYTKFNPYLSLDLD